MFPKQATLCLVMRAWTRARMPQLPPQPLAHSSRIDAVREDPELHQHRGRRCSAVPMHGWEAATMAASGAAPRRYISPPILEAVAATMLDIRFFCSLIPEISQ